MGSLSGSPGAPLHLDARLGDLAVVFLAGVLSVLLLGRVGLPTVVIGPHALALVGDVHTIQTVAELGVVLAIVAPRTVTGLLRW